MVIKWPVLSLQELFGGYDGVHVLVSYLKNDTSKFESGLGHGRLLLAATDCVWCSVIGNQLVEESFLENEGAFILLDLLRVFINSPELNLITLLIILAGLSSEHEELSSWCVGGSL